MTALGKLFRTTAFKLSAIYLVVFSVFAIFLIVYIAHNTTRVLSQQVTERIDEEVTILLGQHKIGGVGRVVRLVERLSMRPGASLYLVTDFAGNPIAGNVADLPAAIIAESGADKSVHRVRYERLDNRDAQGDEHNVALVRVVSLPSGFRLLVGRDIVEREQFRGVVRRAFTISLVVMVALGLLSWFFVNRRVLKRIDSISGTSQQIMAGDLSGRLQVTGTGDEFDRLAESLNVMLGRIEQLMSGLKEVSDNIAHDLKTPLTRMRNRVETALREPADEDRDRDALAQTIEESDQLIRTFDALLAIARVEAGSTGAEKSEINVSEIASEVAEMYEPVAEESGVAFSVDIAEKARVIGNRELIGQALANLIDNALKYGKKTAEGQSKIGLSVQRDGNEIVLAVSDNGPGIPETDRERVRHRFVRLEASRSEPGSGLGLSMVQAVAGLHGGRLEFGDNAPGLKAIMRLPAVT